jgi:HPt (histidine-containing phosphotransfer) domain-containing protein
LAIDRRALGKLRDLVGGEESDLLEIVDTFLEEAPSLMQSLLTASQVQDVNTVRRSAHSLKSNARDMGAVELAEICARIESSGLQGMLPDVTVIENARLAFDVACDELRGICRGGTKL